MFRPFYQDCNVKPLGWGALWVAIGIAHLAVLYYPGGVKTWWWLYFEFGGVNLLYSSSLPTWVEMV
jgi:hypothetical protein